MKDFENRDENKLNLAIRIIKFITTILLAYIIYEVIFSNWLSRKIHFLIYIMLWLYLAYFILPMITRFITKFYLPDYFIGRTKTNDGLLGDPINLAFYAKEEEIIDAFLESGWHRADDLNFKSSIKIGLASIFSRSYKNAPVSSLFLFSRKQDLAFEKEIHGNPRKRHHIRLWKTPKDWYLPGGMQADWLASATFDRNVGLSLFTGQITHKIDPNVDEERDFVIKTLYENSVVDKVDEVTHFTSSYHGRNGGGDRIYTDGSLPFITITDKKHE